MRWLDLFSQFNMTIHHVPGKSNVFNDALSCHPSLSAVFGSVKSSLLTHIRDA